MTMFFTRGTINGVSLCVSILETFDLTNIAQNAHVHGKQLHGLDMT